MLNFIFQKKNQGYKNRRRCNLSIALFEYCSTCCHSRLIFSCLSTLKPAKIGRIKLRQDYACKPRSLKRTEVRWQNSRYEMDPIVATKELSFRVGFSGHSGHLRVEPLSTVERSNPIRSLPDFILVSCAFL